MTRGQTIEMKDTTLFPTPHEYLQAISPHHPVHFFCPRQLSATVTAFQRGFPGMVTFAVKANPMTRVLRHLIKSGLPGFDVASVAEITAICRETTTAALHYNNPVRDPVEIAAALRAGVRSFAVDAPEELAKLRAAGAPATTEVSVRFKLPMRAAAYDFGTKFGAPPAMAEDLLRAVATAGFRPSLTFHTGTQCTDPGAFARHIATAARISAQSGVVVDRLNVGGGFPSARQGPVALDRYFQAIRDAVAAFPGPGPDLLCEPGRGMVADAFALAARVKARRGVATVFLNDGIYGSLSEFPSIGLPRYQVLSSDGPARTGPAQDFRIFGPTCDALDVLPGVSPLPVDVADGDYILFQSMGAYVAGVSTRFNGYGDRQQVTVTRL